MTIRGDKHVDDWMEVAVDYLDGRVDAATKAAVEEHLAGCARCAERLGTQQRVVHLLQDCLLYDPPEDLEYRALGELVFPSPGGKPVYEPPTQAKPPRTSRLARRLRPWVPVGVAVAALLVAVVGYGVVRSGTDQPVTGADVVAPFGTVAETAGAAGERSGGLSTDLPTTTAKAVPSVAGTAPSTTAAVTAVAMTADRKKMIKELENTQAPTYVAFMAQEATPPTDATTAPTDPTAPPTEATDPPATATPSGASGTGSTEGPAAPALLTVTPEQAAQVVSQMAEFSTLEPLDESLWLDGPTYAVYLPRIDAEELVDLVRSIGASVGLVVVMRNGPPGYAVKAVDKLMEHKKYFPILEAARAPQPAVWGFSFTTSTLVDKSGTSAGETESGQTSSTTLPDQSGDHILLVIYVQRVAE